MARHRLSKTTRSLLKLALSGALSLYVIAVVAMPRSAPDYRKAASKHFAAKEYAAALRAIELAMERSPGEFSDPESRRTQAELLHERGECNLHLGRPDHALRDFREARALEPANYRRWVREGEAFLTAERFRDAALLYQEAAVAFPDREQFFRYAAGCAYYQQAQTDYDEALKALNVLVSPAAQPEFSLELRRVVAGTRSIDAVHREFLPPPYDGPERRANWRLIESAQQSFASADQLLEDYATFAGMEPASGLVRVRMDYESGQPYSMRLLAETLLRLEPPAKDSLKIRELLANALYDLGAYRAAADFFLSMRRELQRDKEFLEGRRVTYFAIDALLHEDRGEEALREMDPRSILDEGKILNLFYLGRAQFLTGDVDRSVVALKKAVDALKLVDFSRGGWFRSREHQHWILERLMECLVAAGEWEYALEVVSAAASIYPAEPEWVRQRAAVLRELGRGDAELAADSFELLKSGVRRSEDFEHWMADSRALPEWQDLESQVAVHSDRVLRGYAVTQQARPDGLERIQAAEILARRQQDRDAAGRARASSLLGDIRERYFLGVEVFENLLRQRHEDQAYLLMLGMADTEPEVLQFPFLLARLDFSQGRIEDAARGLRQVLAKDPTDAESALGAWLLLQRLGDRASQRTLEADLLERDPAGTGRLLAALGALEDGFLDVALRAARAAESGAAGDAGGLARGVAALVLWKQGELDAAESIAVPLVEEDASNLLAQLARIGILHQRDPDAAADHLVEHEDELRAMPREYLAHLGRALMEAAAFDPADRILRLVLDQDPAHQVARLDLVDTLLALDRPVEALNHLGQLESTAGTVQRRALIELLQDGPGAAYERLRTRLASSTRGEGVDVWLALLGSAADRMESTFAMPVAEAQLTDDETRFLALQLLLSPASPSVLQGIPTRVRASVSEFQKARPGADAKRDRSLELWLSLELMDPSRREFSRELLPLLLLRRMPDMEPLSLRLEAAVLEHFPKLGKLARDRAEVLGEKGQEEEAARWVAHAVVLDPGDPENLAALLRWTHAMNPTQLKALDQALASRAPDDGVRLLLAGLREEHPDRAVEKLARAEQNLEPPGPAVVARLRVERHRLALEGLRPFETSPYTELGAVNQDQERRRQYEALLEEALAGNAGDPTVVDFVAEVLYREDPATVAADIAARLERILVQRPQPLWNAYRTAARLLESRDAELESFESLSVSLRQALAQNPGVPADLALAECLTTLVRGLRGRSDPSVVQALLDQAEAICPYAPDVLAEKAAIAEEEGNAALAEKLRSRAVVCGDDSPEVLAWLAEYAFLEKASLTNARDLVERAFAALGPAPAPELLIRVSRTRSRIDYVLGLAESARAAMETALRTAHRDPRESPEYAMQLFASSSAEALDVVRHLAEQEGPRQQQMQRFLAVLEQPEEPGEEGRGQRARPGRGGEGAGERPERAPISVPEARSQRRPARSEGDRAPTQDPEEGKEPADAGNGESDPVERPAARRQQEPGAEPRARRTQDGKAPRELQPGGERPQAGRPRPEQGADGEGRPRRAREPRPKPPAPPPDEVPDGG